MSSRRLTYFTIGVLSGLAAGVVIGLMVAPDSGARTRRRIANEARRAADVARAVADRAERLAAAVGAQVDHALGREEEAAWKRVARLRDGVQRYSRTVMAP
ncbi:MAG: YtxH domain-containing protein [Coriobacteriia bacterium]|nr:YtxH domain-containing protein [Coriobacteriia bacterium]